MKNIAVIFGGRSAEHDVSIITAHVPIIESLIASGEFEVYPIYIAKDGSWYSDKSMRELSFFKQPDFESVLAKQKKIQLSFDKGLKIIWPGLMSKEVQIDIVFPSMHGTFGEDGSLMGLLRMAQVPFVGCDLFASAVAMDKALTKQVLRAEGIPIVPFVWFTKSDWLGAKDVLMKEISDLKWPLFVKPVHLGSSIAISKVKDKAGLENAVEVAFHYDNKVLVEEAVENLIEVTLPIMGNNELRLGAIERPLNKTEFFNFSDKYLQGGKKGDGRARAQYSEIPANIDEGLAAEVEKSGKKTFHVLGCSGICRVDFLINESAKMVYVNEVNTLPGSLYHHNWKKIGVSNVELVTLLVSLAEERFQAEKNINYFFVSEILKKISGPKV